LSVSLCVSCAALDSEIAGGRHGQLEPFWRALSAFAVPVSSSIEAAVFGSELACCSVREDNLVACGNLARRGDVGAAHLAHARQAGIHVLSACISWSVSSFH
jgi:hypothetical protein